ncbi:MAG: HD domain-containing protein [Peptococcaceae bacterium]|nr:HD domain-containing protein [Peptococcaceae bacterium]
MGKVGLDPALLIFQEVLQLNFDCLTIARQNLSGNPALESHCSRVALLALESAKIMRLPDPEEIATGAYLHDLGKTVWPAELFKKYPLDGLDWNVVHVHPIVSENLAMEIWPDVPVRIRAIVRGHHERPGGKGYPDRLIDLSTEVLLVAACDAFDAMTNNREYRPNGIIPIEKALMEISLFATSQIVAAIATSFIRKVQEYAVHNSAD